MLIHGKYIHITGVSWLQITGVLILSRKINIFSYSLIQAYLYLEWSGFESGITCCLCGVIVIGNTISVC